MARIAVNQLRLLCCVLLLGVVAVCVSTAAWAEDPPAPVVVEESAAPINDDAKADDTAESESADSTTTETTKDESADGKDGKTEDKAEAADEVAVGEVTLGENAGLEDLDKATQLKVAAESLPDLNDVVDKLDSAMEKGLDKDNQSFAEDLLIAALLQRSTILSSAVLDRPITDPQQIQRWMQVRQFAVNDLQRVLALDDDIWEAHLLMGRLQALPHGDEKTAKRELTKVIKAPEAAVEDRAQALALRGTLQSDEKKREQDFDEAVALVPEKPDYYRIRGQYRYGRNQFAEALTDVDKAIELEPEHSGTYELRGLILVGLEKPDEALAAFNKASELSPQAVRPHQQLGEVYRQKGDLKKASEQLSKALDLAPGDAATLLLRANVLYQLHDTDGALKDVDAVIKAQPQLLLAHLLRAEILASGGKVDQAIEHLEKLVPLAPNQTKLLEPLATFYLVEGQPRKSIEMFSKVIEMEPENYRARRFRGDAHLNIGDHAEAVKDFDAAYALNDEDEGLLNNFAWVLATSPDDKVRDGKRSIELATKAAEASSYTVPHILSTLAAAYAESGDFDSAKKWSKKAVELGADDATKEQLGKELTSYEEGKPWREKQVQEDKKSSPAASDQTFAPPSAEPAPARTLDF